jgi:hypothetical protein
LRKNSRRLIAFDGISSDRRGNARAGDLGKAETSPESLPTLSSM